MSDSRIALVASDPPQYHDRSSTTRIMWIVTLCLLPGAGWGVYLYGTRAALVLAAAILSAVVFEAAAARLASRVTLRDGSAVLCGLLIGMSLSPAVPLFIPVVASAFAMFVVKWSFGGLGGNWMNPALAGRVFVAFSWPGAMTTWPAPRTLDLVDGLAGATPLSLVKATAPERAQAPIAVLRDAGYPVSAFDTEVTSWLNVNVLGPAGVNLPTGYVDLFVGNVAGSIGEASALLLLAGTIFLFARRIITWHVPAAFFVTFAVCTRVFGGLTAGLGLFEGDVLFSVLTGGFVLASFYMATDPVTSPLTGGGMLIYGSVAGIIAFVLRAYGQFPESVALAIILVNAVVPLIDRLCRPRRFGHREVRHGS